MSDRPAIPSACPNCAARLPDEPLLVGRDRMFGRPGRWGVVRCPECRLASTVPRPSPAELGGFYPDEYPAFAQAEASTSDGDGRPDLITRFREARFDALLRISPYRRAVAGPPGRMLDVGCGSGELGEAFLRSGWRASGVEPAAAGAAASRARGLDVHEGTLTTATWEPGSFDLITFHHSLEHVPDPPAVLSRARELLAPGGEVIVSVPNFGSWQRRVFGSRWFHLDIPRHLQHFDTRTLPMVMRRSGLEPFRLEAFSSKLGLWASVQYALFGRCMFRGAALALVDWLAYALYPLVWAGDRFGQADSVHVSARASRA